MFPTRRLGVNFSFAKEIYQKCKLSLRRILRLSKNSEIKRLHASTSVKIIRSDSIINTVLSKNSEFSYKQVASKTDQLFNKQVSNNRWNNCMTLSVQNTIIKHIISVCCSKIIAMWQSLTQRLPNNIVYFIRKALILSLPNRSNLHRWKIVDTNMCNMCHKGPETKLHILSNCSNCLDRYSWRHNSVLLTIVNKLSRATCNNLEIYADLPNNNRTYPCTSDLFSRSRPDIVIKLNDKVIVLELTVCFEIFLEVTTYCFISSASYKPFNDFLTEIGVNKDRTTAKCMETAIRVTYYIFCRWGKIWTSPDLLGFY